MTKELNFFQEEVEVNPSSEESRQSLETSDSWSQIDLQLREHLEKGDGSFTICQFRSFASG